MLYLFTCIMCPSGVNVMEWIASAAFGLEGLVKRELQALGLETVMDQGGVRFTGEPEDAFRANLWLRTADRVQLIVGEGEARSFEELFQLVGAIRWEDYVPKGGAFPVTGQCARSQLMSVRDVQAISKKAAAERLKKRYKTEWLDESGAGCDIHVAIHQDRVRVTLDASGEALNRRGYRTWNGEAPLRETLAAALVELSPWRPGKPLHDPCCGTGTILVEAAFKMADRAPGLTRGFAMEGWHFIDQKCCDEIRREARFRFNPALIEGISGSDIDPEALALCKKHLAQAGLKDKIPIFQKDLRDLEKFAENTCVIVNPPYGERLGSKKEADALYRGMRKLESSAGAANVCVLTASPSFERLYGRRAQRKRRLYNGRLECEYLIF